MLNICLWKEFRVDQVYDSNDAGETDLENIYNAWIQQPFDRLHTAVGKLWSLFVNVSDSLGMSCLF